MSTTELIIFIHIAKTGGTTLRDILDKQYGQDSLFMYAHETIESLNTPIKILNMLKEHIHTARALSGHYSFGMKYEEINDPLLPLIKTSRKIIYISLLRKPVERIFSLYHHHKRNNWLHDDVTFETFIRNKLYTLNHQTICLAGTPNPDFHLAQKNIIQHFAVVGVTDMYIQSLFLMQKHFNWKPLKYNKLNQFIKTSEINDIPKQIVEQINHDNYLDVKLHKFAKRILKKKIKSLSKPQQKELRYFSPF
ncbi:sulfotransferase family 2 domain-containing protein [Bacillus paranthracis]|uniref:Sulfotransferase family 2 domain-containing protein n=1 Tax=Bacillus paranthracis TaxID=2026186 RepID=A0AAJ1K6M9_9BACI|nr:sulfotransferase family 2 domain-containing protein [Bacillus paranthracis]MDG0949875.1 sulfotransferase family 2 domain-containing protein [Bacillus paranthracis]MDG0955702.1 sulfotransferase family 2 domain-containing protein [Bacillus paranthracis]